MDEGNSIIYGLEHQTRALSPQLGESDAVRFLIGTQILKPDSNQVHVVELEEDTGALHTKTRALSPQLGESDAVRFLIGTQILKPDSNQVHVVELEEDTGALHTKTRALSPQLGESDAVRFLIGTQILKPDSNQVHVVELEEDTGALHTKVFKHNIGEIWHLRCSPHDVASLLTVHNSYDTAALQCYMGVTVFKLPTIDVIPKDLDELSLLQGRNPEDLELVQTITPEKPDEEIRCAEWHPTDQSRIGVVYEGAIRVYDLTDNKCVNTATPDGRAHNKFTSGKWNPHQGQTQFAALQENHIKCYDIRDSAKPAWTIDNAHNQLVRDVDFNPNRQFQLASVGDDAALNIWDFRNGKEPIFSRSDHSHWVWTIRYNSYHEQLLLSGSSDARALLTAAASVCKDDDEDGKRQSDILEDGVLQSYEQHEDSVYCVEWSAVDPWTFASLSYDGRLVLSRVPRHFKYKILL